MDGQIQEFGGRVSANARAHDALAGIRAFGHSRALRAGGAEPAAQRPTPMLTPQHRQRQVLLLARRLQVLEQGLILR